MKRLGLLSNVSQISLPSSFGGATMASSGPWLLAALLMSGLVGWAVADLGSGEWASYLLGSIAALAVLISAWAATEISFVALMSGVLFQNWLAVLAGRGTPLGETISRLDDYLLVIFVLTIVLRAVFDRRKVRLPFLPVIGVYLAIGLASALMNAVPINVAVIGAYLAIKLYVVLVAAVNIPWSRHAHRLPAVLLVWGVVGLVVGLAQFVFGPVVNELLHLPSIMQSRAGLSAVTSVFVHPGYFGWFMAVCAVVAFTAYLEQVGSKWTLPLGVMFVLGVVLSLRVKPMLGLLGAAPLAILLTRRGRSRGLVLAAATAAVVVLIAGSVVSDVFAFNWNQYAGGDTSQIARNALYAKSVEVARDTFPLGAGFGRFGTWMSVSNYSPLYSKYGLDTVWGLTRDNPAFAMDTFWPGVLGEAGWLGAIAMGAFVASLLWVLLRRARSMHSSTARFINIAAALAVLEGVFESLGSPLFVNQPSVIVLGALVGLALSWEGEEAA